MRKKQILAFLLAGILTVGTVPSMVFAAEDTDIAVLTEEENTGSEPVAEVPAEEPSEAPAEEPTETPTEEPTEAPTEAPSQPTDSPEEPSYEDPVPETPAENTPAATPTDVPQTILETLPETLNEPTISPTVSPAPEGITIVDGETTHTYTTLNEAVTAARSMTSSAENPIKIIVRGETELTETIQIQDGNYVAIVGAGEDTQITRKGDFTGDMFFVSGGMLLFQVSLPGEGESTPAGSLTVDGSNSEGNPVSGSIVNVTGGTFGMEDGVTLTGNTMSGDDAKGGAIRHTGGNLLLAGGSITENQAALGGGVYTESELQVGGGINVSGNTSDGVNSRNVLLKGTNASINVVKALSDSAKIGVIVSDIPDGTQIVKAAATGGTPINLEDILVTKKLIRYEGTDSKTIDGSGFLRSATVVTPSPTPVVTKPQLATNGRSSKWTSHDSAEIKGISTKDGWVYAEWVVRGSSAPAMSCTGQGTEVKANIQFTLFLSDFDSDKEIDIYLRLKDKDGNLSNKYLLKMDESSRPAEPTVTPSRQPKTPKVTESTVTGLENPLKFYPNTFYDFKVTGAGTDNNDPVYGDVKWVPLYWSTSSNPSDAQKHTNWKIGAKAGIAEAATYNLYVFFRKYVYDGNSWQATDVIESATYQFRSEEIEITATPTPNGYTGGSGGSSSDPTALTRTDGTEGTGASSTSKNAVSTADNSPVATMLMLAAVSLLAGGYVLIRKRKKTAE